MIGSHVYAHRLVKWARDWAAASYDSSFPVRVSAGIKDFRLRNFTSILHRTSRAGTSCLSVFTAAGEFACAAVIVSLRWDVGEDWETATLLSRNRSTINAT